MIVGCWGEARREGYWEDELYDEIGPVFILSRMRALNVFSGGYHMRFIEALVRNFVPWKLEIKDRIRRSDSTRPTCYCGVFRGKH